MGLINKTHKEYYQSNDLGNYQFTSLDDIVTQFQIAYVGEGKIIPKIKRADIAFHAQRALQELSFDTFKSIKSYQIDVSASLTMPLPHDYVNYAKLTWVDSSGIEHPLYPTSRTSNPFQIRQNDDNSYRFETEGSLVQDGTFDGTVNGAIGGSWTFPTLGDFASAWDGVYTYGTNNKYNVTRLSDKLYWDQGSLEFDHYWFTYAGNYSSHAYAVFQEINLKGVRSVTLKATGESADQQTNSVAGDIADYGILRVGLTSTNPNTGLKDDGSIGWARPPGSIGGGVDLSGTAIDASKTNPFHQAHPSPNTKAASLDLTYLEWNDGSSSEQESDEIDVTNYDRIWVCVQSYVPFQSGSATTFITGSVGGTTAITPTSATYITASTNMIDEIIVLTGDQPSTLQLTNVDGNSSIWNNYKSTTPSENNNDDYKDDTYWPANGERYGLDPQHAQANGSFFIDPRLGKIHFSSNISGKTVILDYISDSLGTDEEMQVHKLAEEAMYKWIAYAILSTSSLQIHQQLAPRFKKEKFAETRKAKLRLSNIKLEELTQILRGKSKWIKH